MALTKEERRERRLARKARRAAENGTEVGAGRERVKLEELEPLEKVSQPVRMPAEMKILVQKAASEAGLSATSWARGVIAKELGYTVPSEFSVVERGAAPVGDRAKAKKAKSAGRRAIIKQLLEKYKAGEITVDQEAIEAAVEAALAKNEAEDEEAEAESEEDDDEE